MKKIKQKEVVVYQTKTGAIEFKGDFKQETIWATQKQIGDVFGVDRSVVGKHLKNIFLSAELRENSVCAKFAHTAEDGKVYEVLAYNLDAILSVGYRVNSKQASQFRIWATKVLRSHLVQGYTINQKRLQEQQTRLNDLQKAVVFMREKAARPELAGQTQELLSVIEDYATSLSLFYQYDKGTLALKKNKKPSIILNYDIARKLVDETKLKLIEKGEAGDLFGQEYGDKFKSILGALYQTFGGVELYNSVEEKAANLLYLVIKDHPFADGNKRTGALLFVYFLERNKYLWRKTGERKISDTTLVALALLVAESNPKEKDMMIKLITNLLV
ncbi:MAG: virulence protein RhuM/Fic/DOC family protein [Candidatus Magasanikbacteria bacterium]|nr:virulence protein RhuM/Fic/DOC family protein [Candidatus Magasanikbacteria bacterium]